MMVRMADDSDRDAAPVDPGDGPWHLYLLRCADGTLYTGITVDLEQRLRAHNAGRGARYTRGRRPVTLLAAWFCESERAARSAEVRFKRLRRARKLSVAAGTAPLPAGAWPTGARASNGTHGVRSVGGG